MNAGRAVAARAEKLRAAVELLTAPAIGSSRSNTSMRSSTPMPQRHSRAWTTPGSTYRDLVLGWRRHILIGRRSDGARQPAHAK
jgi:hypothetical protein